MGCAEHGVKGILCEKPITDSLAHADEMVATCRAKGIAFGCGDLDRNLPDYTRAKAIIDSGEIGEVVAIDLHGGSSTEWDIQGMSLTRLFAGDAEAAWVIGWVTGDPYSDHDQGQAGYIRFANGIEAFRHTNKNAKNGIEVLCTMGSFYTDFLYLKMWKLEDPDVKPGWSNGMVEIEGLFKEESQYAESGTHDEDGWRWAETRNLASVQVMIEAIENGVDPIGSGENSRKCLEIAIALRESHRRGRTPVRLPSKTAASESSLPCRAGSTRRRRCQSRTTAPPSPTGSWVKSSSSFPHPNPSFPHPNPSFPQPNPSFPQPNPSFLHPNRHSCGGRNPQTQPHTRSLAHESSLRPNSRQQSAENWVRTNPSFLHPNPSFLRRNVTPYPDTGQESTNPAPQMKAPCVYILANNPLRIGLEPTRHSCEGTSPRTPIRGRNPQIQPRT